MEVGTHVHYGRQLRRRHKDQGLCLPVDYRGGALLDRSINIEVFQCCRRKRHVLVSGHASSAFAPAALYATQDAVLHPARAICATQVHSLHQHPRTSRPELNFVAYGSLRSKHSFFSPCFCCRRSSSIKKRAWRDAYPTQCVQHRLQETDAAGHHWLRSSRLLCCPPADEAPPRRPR